MSNHKSDLLRELELDPGDLQQESFEGLANRSLAGEAGQAAGNNSPHYSIMILAGEASGDHHGASLVRALRELQPEAQFQFFGSGGEAMRHAGVELIVDLPTLNIVGAEEFLTGFRRIWRSFNKLRSVARERQPDLVVFIDYPDFNMRLAKRIKRDGSRTVYYITPQVWAWRQHRVRALRRDFDRLLVILPFEKDFYSKAGVPVDFVGHPLLDSLKPPSSRDQFLDRHGLDHQRPLIALLPGSRRQEIQVILPHLMDAVSILSRRSPDEHQFVLPIAPGVSIELLRRVVQKQGGKLEESVGQDSRKSYQIALSDGSVIRIVSDDTQNAIRYAKLAIAASGTIVLETGIIGTPMIVVYRVSWLNWRLFRWLIDVKHFGLVNLIAGREIVPELIQNEFTGNRLAELFIELIGDSNRLSQIQEDLRLVREQLGSRASERAAAAVLATI